MVADDVVDGRAEFLQLVAEDDLPLGDDAVDHDDVARHRLDERADGVIPIPPATSSTFSRVRASSVNVPSGPSATTRVPDAVGEPGGVVAEILTVIRSDRPSGAAERENGCADQHPAAVEEAPEEELSRPAR